MKIFITATFRKTKNKFEIERLCSVVREAGFEDFCFIRDIEHYKKIFSDPRQLMLRTTEEIKNSDSLLFDATKKSTGRAIELGIAYSNHKKIIILVKNSSKIKDSVRGVADEIITYAKIEDIRDTLRRIYKDWNTK